MAEDAFTRIAARADLCRLLAACFYQPGPEFVEEAVFESIAAAAVAVDPALAESALALGEAFGVQPLLELQVDYTRLFMNPSGSLAPPYESVWLGGNDPAVAQQTADAVRAAYRDAGFQIDAGFRDLPDHVAAELEFVYTLLYSEARACSLGDATSGQQAVDRRGRFLARHLGRWIGPFCGAVRDSAQTRYYRTLADLTERFVAREIA
jgi:TorA maturation chaperone TorD